MAIQMTRSYCVAAGIAALFAFGSVSAEGLLPTQGNSENAADVVFDIACTQAWVDVGPNSEPFWPNGAGGILVGLENGVSVRTSPNGGRVNLNCKGHLPMGEQVTAIDVVTGELILATLATRDEACEALGPVFPDVCRGNNGPVVINFETTGLECFDTVGGMDIFTTDSMGLTTSSGASMINCHFDLDDAPQANSVSVDSEPAA